MCVNLAVDIPSSGSVGGVFLLKAIQLQSHCRDSTKNPLLHTVDHLYKVSIFSFWFYRAFLQPCV